MGRLLGTLVSAALVGVSPAWAAGGFSLPFDSVGASGMGFAGVDAADYDPGAAVRNPALHGLALESGLATGAHFAHLSTQFQGVAVREGTDGSTISGGNSGRSGRVDAPIPDWTWTRRMSDRFAVGVTLAAPYGTSQHRDADWKGRYNAIDTVIRGIELTPGAAWQVTPRLRVGVGARLHWFDFEYSNDVDLGAIVQREVEARAGADLATPACALAGEETLPGKYDFRHRAEASRFTAAWQAGLRMALTDQVAVGLSYLSPIEHGLHGDATRQRLGWTLEDFENDPCFSTTRVALLATGGSFEEEVVALVRAATSDTGFGLTLTLPETLSSGVAWTVDRWTFASSLRWTRWSRFDEVIIRFDNATPTVRSRLEFQDAYLVALGMRYQLNERWTLSAGVAGESAAVSDENRSATSADAGRLYLTGGFSWVVNERRTVDFSTGVLRSRGGEVDDVDPMTGNRVTGRYQPLTLLWFGLRMRWRL
ncbi:MAG: outer membrane protein transport protein [Abyssibacter sp.]|nr:outer membrane protein transport protein [Abyssibacter sp.]MCK5859752.1 outer membrane protein transport protein [Abyssibacter sp.]